jgi:amidase
MKRTIRRITCMLAVLLVCLLFAFVLIQGWSLAQAQSVTITPLGVQPSAVIPWRGDEEPIGNSADRPFDVVETTIPQIQAALDAGRLSCRQLVQRYLRRIRAYDQDGPHLNAIRDLNPRALQIARELDRERRHSGRRGPLHCIPVLLKDNIDTADQPTTAGSLALAGSLPLDDAFITQRLRDAGAIILGKANLTEFAHHLAAGMPGGFSSLGGFTFNPYNPEPLPGGDGRPVLPPGSSSSGSAVAVNANLVSVAIGTETISSIIGPASINGIVGIKPTRGLLSRAGIIPVSDSQDTPGPMGRTVTDAAILLGALTGVDPEDPATWESEGQFYRDYTPFLDADALGGARIGVPRDFFWDPSPTFTSEMRTIMESAIALMENLGAQIIDADIPNARNLMPRNFVLDYELKRDLNAYLGRLGPEAPVRTLADVIAFNEAHAERALRYGQDLFLRAEAVDLERDLERYLAARARDVRLARDEGLGFVLEAYQLDVLLFPERQGSYLGAKAGYPSVHVPAGYLSNGAGYGVTFLGRAFSEPVLIGLAYAYEQASLARRPPASTPPLR